MVSGEFGLLEEALLPEGGIGQDQIVPMAEPLSSQETADVPSFGALDVLLKPEDSPPTFGEQAQEAISSFVSSMAEVPAGVLDSTAIIYDAIDDAISGDDTPLSERSAARFASGIRDLAEKLVPGVQAAESFLIVWLGSLP